MLTTILLIFYSFQGTILTPLALFLILVALNLDSIQTMIIACLSGMWAQEFSTQGAPYAALAIFAFVQIILIYLPVVSAAVIAFDILRPIHTERWIVESLIAGAMLAMLALAREMVIRAMWHDLGRRLL